MGEIGGMARMVGGGIHGRERGSVSGREKGGKVRRESKTAAVVLFVRNGGLSHALCGLVRAGSAVAIPRAGPRPC